MCLKSHSLLNRVETWQPSNNKVVLLHCTLIQCLQALSQYNKITEQCFMACIHDFTSRRIINAENSCALNCLEKYMKMTNRISLRFQEHQLISNDALAAAHQKSN
ncbi:Mitochondrial import inner membrane translocase subunit Tim9 [Bulinus truncatus]|nr:Mitochondrial import inner membrane translocase subunit Tim9 [Bulinus truncatus]